MVPPRLVAPFVLPPFLSALWMPSVSPPQNLERGEIPQVGRFCDDLIAICDVLVRSMPNRPSRRRFFPNARRFAARQDWLGNPPLSENRTGGTDAPPPRRLAPVCCGRIGAPPLSPRRGATLPDRSLSDPELVAGLLYKDAITHVIPKSSVQMSQICASVRTRCHNDAAGRSADGSFTLKL
jgi:hypothetical protein